MSELLTNSEIDAAAARLPNWTVRDASLVRTVELPTFPTAIEFVSRVADAAERADHHPDIDIRWRKITLTLSTHSAGGLTRKDVAMARQIDSLLPDD